METLTRNRIYPLVVAATKHVSQINQQDKLATVS